MYQSAYHGTPHKFDEFSLDAIGTGEGAQAHGWGQYMVLSPEQIKSVDNRGTFDAENPNIYYQTGIPEIDNSEKYQQLPDDLKEVIDFIFNGKSVYEVTGEEFPNNGENLNERVNEFYKEKFNNKIINSIIGEIKLDKRSIKDSIYHGINKDKINAFAAVPYVLQNGKLANIKENYKGKEEVRYLFAAPITLRGEEYFCEVVVKSNKDRQGFYLHEIELKKKLVDVFSTSQQGTSTSSKSIIADLVKKYNPNIKKHEDISFQDNLENNYYRFDDGNSVVKISKIEDLGEAPTISSGAIAEFETLEVGKNYTILSNGKKQIVGPTLTFNDIKNGVLEFSNNKDKEYQKTTIEIKESELDNYRGRIYPAEFNVKEKIKEHNKKVSNFVVPQEPVERLIDTNKPLREILDEKRGLSTTRYNFDGTIKDNYIVLLKNRADKSTLLHEFAHVYLATLNMLAIADKSIKDELNTLNNWLDYRGGQYTEKQHEKFAKGFEAYVMSGKAPTYPLKRAFENFRVWLKDVYNSILFGENSSDFELDKETKEIFDNLLGDISVEVRNKRSKELIEKARANASLRLCVFLYKYIQSCKSI